jgi:hypothetical protein
VSERAATSPTGGAGQARASCGTFTTRWRADVALGTRAIGLSRSADPETQARTAARLRCLCGQSKRSSRACAWNPLSGSKRRSSAVARAHSRRRVDQAARLFSGLGHLHGGQAALAGDVGLRTLRAARTCDRQAGLPLAPDARRRDRADPRCSPRSTAPTARLRVDPHRRRGVGPCVGGPLRGQAGDSNPRAGGSSRRPCRDPRRFKSPTPGDSNPGGGDSNRRTRRL